MVSIRAQSITKSYGPEVAVQDISITVNEGELFGLIGPDGAGKTTLFQIFTSLLIPDGGRAEVCGFDTVKQYREIRKIIGYMPGKFSLYQDLTVEENLNFFATIFGTSISQNYHLIRDIFVHLEPFRKRRAGQLSGGMKQKLALSCALIHRPKALFLDEPTTGIDAVSRAEFWEMLSKLKETGITILVSTPYMDEASRCERIALIQKGRILGTDNPDGILKSFKKNLFAVKTSQSYQSLKDLRTASFSERVEPFGEFHHLTSHDKISPAIIESFLLDKGHEQIEVRSIKATIEDVFLELS